MYGSMCCVTNNTLTICCSTQRCYSEELPDSPFNIPDAERGEVLAACSACDEGAAHREAEHVLKQGEQTCTDTRKQGRNLPKMIDLIFTFHFYQLAYCPIWKNILKTIAVDENDPYVHICKRKRSFQHFLFNQRTFQNAQKTFYKWCWDLEILLFQIIILF